MKKIIKTSPKTTVEMFETNDLHRYYDFSHNKHGEVIISSKLIKDIYNYAIKSTEDICKARALCSILKEADVNFESGFNFTIEIDKGKIKISIGNLCAKIWDNLFLYRDYLKKLEDNGIETYIEFQ